MVRKTSDVHLHMEFVRQTLDAPSITYSNDCSSLSPCNAQVPWSGGSWVRFFPGTEKVAADCVSKLFSSFPSSPHSLCSLPGPVFLLWSVGTGCAPASLHLASLTFPWALTFVTWWEGKSRSMHPSMALPAPQLCQRPCWDASSNWLFWCDTQLHWLQPHKAGKGRAISFFIKRIYKHTVHKHFSFLHSDGWLYVYEMFSFIWRQSNQNQSKLWWWREEKQVGVGLTVPLSLPGLSKGSSWQKCTPCRWTSYSAGNCSQSCSWPLFIKDIALHNFKSNWLRSGNVVGATEPACAWLLLGRRELIPENLLWMKFSCFHVSLSPDSGSVLLISNILFKRVFSTT